MSTSAPILLPSHSSTASELVVPELGTARSSFSLPPATATVRYYQTASTNSDTILAVCSPYSLGWLLPDAQLNFHPMSQPDSLEGTGRSKDYYRHRVGPRSLVVEWALHQGYRLLIARESRPDFVALRRGNAIDEGTYTVNDCHEYVRVCLVRMCAKKVVI